MQIVNNALMGLYLAALVAPWGIMIFDHVRGKRGEWS